MTSSRRRFGRAGGFAAGAVLALTPIAVAVSRHNNPDALLVLCVVGALWGVVRALEDGRVRWLVVAGACVGLGFEVKMGAALLVVPALSVAWLWAAPRNRVRGVFAGGAAMLVAGLFWPVLVWLTPASARPWISGTSDNSVWSLIMDYNGLGRLDGQAGGRAAGPDSEAAGTRARSAATRARCGCSTTRSAAKPAGCSVSRSSSGHRAGGFLAPASQ